MSYEILQFNLGTGEAQGYVLRGTGEHEGTNASLSAADMENLLWQAQQMARERPDYEAPVNSFLMGESKASPQEAAALAELLDRQFLKAHASSIPPPPGETE